MSRVYIASGLENADEVKEIMTSLRKAGHEISYDWTVHGSVQLDGDARIREVAENEINGVLSADLVIVVLPGGRGTHVELGIALGTVQGPTGPSDIIIYGRDERDPVPGAMLDEHGRICCFYRAMGVSFVSKDAGLGRLLENVRRLTNPLRFR